MDSKILGERIRKARERANLSQEELALLVARDQRAISEYEHGKRKLPATDLPNFARVLNVPLLYFFEGETSVQDLDAELLEEFHRLPTLESQQAAIEILRIYSSTIELHNR